MAATHPSEITNQRFDARQAQPSTEQRMLQAIEQLADTTEAIRLDLVKFEQMVERFILAQKL